MNTFERPWQGSAGHLEGPQHAGGGDEGEVQHHGARQPLREVGEVVHQGREVAPRQQLSGTRAHPKPLQRHSCAQMRQQDRRAYSREAADSHARWLFSRVSSAQMGVRPIKHRCVTSSLVARGGLACCCAYWPRRLQAAESSPVHFVHCQLGTSRRSPGSAIRNVLFTPQRVPNSRNRAAYPSIATPLVSTTASVQSARQTT